MFTEYTYPSSDGQNTIAGYQWTPEGEAVAILQITHGVGEHSARYADFAEYLNKFGIVVVANDDLGHGKSCESADWGYFGPKDGWLRFADDVEKNRQIADEKFPGLPHYLLGHSMGSFVCRTYLSMYGNNIDGAIIMGTAGANPATSAGMALVSIIKAFRGERYKSPLITNMAFGGYNARMQKPYKSSYEWLSRDYSIVEKYDADPACGFMLTLAGFMDLFHLLKYINSKDCFGKTPKDKKYLFVAGAEDPVGAYGKGPTEVAGNFLSHGITETSLKIYPGMRHEILNEIGKEEVYEDMKAFILSEEL